MKQIILNWIFLLILGVHSKDIQFSKPDSYNVFLPDLQNTITEVACRIYKLGVMDVDTEKQTILLNVGLTLEWNDDRLNITGTDTTLVSFIYLSFDVFSGLTNFNLESHNTAYQKRRHLESKSCHQE